MLKVLLVLGGVLAAVPAVAQTKMGPSSANPVPKCFNAECSGYYDLQPTGAECDTAPRAEIPSITGEGYPAARGALLKGGWRPLPAMDGELGSTEAWAVDAGYNEVEVCSGTGVAPCRFNFSDANGNRLRIVTEGEGGDPEYPPSVVGVSMLCKP